MFGNLQIDFIAVLVAAVLNLIIRYFWYSNLMYGDLFKDNLKSKFTFLNFFFNFCSSLILAFFLAFFLSFLKITTVKDGMFVGLCFWLGFIVPSNLTLLLQNQLKRTDFFLNIFYLLFSMVSMGGVIGA
jgi:hypothetical protein